MEIQAEYPRRPWLMWLFGTVGIAALSVPVIDHLRRDPNDGKPKVPTPSAVEPSSTSPDGAREALATEAKSRLIQAGWPEAAAGEVVDLNLDWFLIQFEENAGGFERQLKLLEALGDHPQVFATVEKQPELAGLLAGAASPEDVCASLSVPDQDYQPLVGLFLQHVDAPAQTALSHALQSQRSTIRFLQERGILGAEVLFMHDRPAAATPGSDDWSLEYDRWLHDELESRRHVPDEELASFVNLVLSQGPEIRRRLAEDESFRREFRTLIWPKLNNAASGSMQNMLELFVGDPRIWDLLRLDAGEELLKRTGPLGIDLLYGYPEEDRPGYPTAVHDEVIKILLNREPLSIQALLEFRREPLFVRFLKKEISNDTRTAALAKLFQARPNHTELLATYSRWSGATLADDVGPPPHGVITWVPFYYTVYEVPKKWLQGRDATVMDLLQAGLDPVMLVADVFTAGGTAVSRRALIVAGRGATEKLGKKVVLVTLEKTAADLAVRKLGAEAAEKLATKGSSLMADWSTTALLTETQAMMKGMLRRASTIDVTNLVQFLHRYGGMHRRTMKEWLGIEARLFMRGDAKVFFSLSNVPSKLLGAKAAEFLARTSKDLMIGGVVESEPGQDAMREAARKTIGAKEYAAQTLHTWQQHVSALWLLQASQPSMPTTPR